MQLKLANFRGKTTFISVIKKKDAPAAMSLKWKKDEVKTVEDQMGYDLLSKYPGLFLDVTHKETRGRKPKTDEPKEVQEAEKQPENSFTL